MNKPPPAIRLLKVCVRLSGTEVLHAISARLPRGRLVGLVGPNGSGKSTLLRAASGQVPLSGGSVEIAGQPLARMPRRKIARHVCLLAQDANLTFPFSVREVVSMGRNPYLGRFQPMGATDRQVVQWAMQQASVLHLAERPVTELSGGEKQRTLLARSLATQAPTLLLDEPTTGLDILHQLELLDLLQRLTQQGKTIVAALHDLNVARRICSHVLLLDQGRLVAEGPSAETLCQKHVEQVFGIRVSAVKEAGLEFALPDSSPSGYTGGRP